MSRAEIAEILLEYCGKETATALMSILKDIHRNDLVESVEKKFVKAKAPSATSESSSMFLQPHTCGTSTPVQRETVKPAQDGNETQVGEVVHLLNNKDMKLFVMTLSSNQNVNGSYEDIVFNTLSVIGRVELAQMLIYNLAQQKYALVRRPV